MELQATVVVGPIPVDALLDAVPLLIERWRRLDIDGRGAVDPSGTRRTGLRILQGRHPFPSTRYGVVAEVEELPEVSPEDARRFEELVSGRGGDRREATAAWRADRRRRALVEGTVRTVLRAAELELQADDPARFVLRATDVDGSYGASIGLVRPADLERADVEARVAGEADGFLSGPWEVVASVDAAHLRQLDGHPTVAEGTVRHRRIRGSAAVRVGRVDGGCWEVEVRIAAQGRGVLRPVVALAALVGGGWLRRSLAAGLADGAADLDLARTELVARFGASPSPDALADALLAEAFAALPDEAAED